MPKRKRRRTTLNTDEKRLKAISSVVGNSANDRRNLEGQSRGTPVIGDNHTLQAQIRQLGDFHLSTNQRHNLATQIGEVQGNNHLKHVFNLMRSSDTKGDDPGIEASTHTVARSVQSEAERLARTSRTGSWSELTQTDFNAVARAIQRGNHQAAIRRIVRTLPISSDHLRRVVLRIIPISLDGDAEPFVPVKDGCADQPVSNHWSHHSPDEIRVLVRINPRVFTEYTLRDRVIRLHTTLAHEFTHVEQFVTGGIDNRTRFRRDGNKEFLTMASSGEAEYVGALQEIDAVSAEIENMIDTLLMKSELIRHAVNYLWENYVSYRRGVHGPVNSAIANRVYTNIHLGRQALYTFIDSELGYRAVLRTVRASGGHLTPRRVIENWLYICPRGYNESWIGGFVTDPTASAEGQNSRDHEARLRADLPAILGRIRRFRGEERH